MGHIAWCLQLTFKGAALMLCVLNTYTHTQKEGLSESLGGVGYVCYLDFGDGTMGVCMCLNSSSCTH